ncbi:uncharacterized protein BX663DRAFT_559488 [Cokeromyces recurvatus]|uniref:uncharacterized protein n=1 Tax=Cokeromyces recurvatus TaxID=90255 RepID=UPI00222023DA|nr:uncharacterized protein BX663DRAFT_559488 [Cokeromyces recurvatus]KAI7905317.1 hypothetical protein BX663DRAFT_559488 [Cokeromyces recurvatus]
MLILSLCVYISLQLNLNKQTKKKEEKLNIPPSFHTCINIKKNDDNDDLLYYNKSYKNQKKNALTFSFCIFKAYINIYLFIFFWIFIYTCFFIYFSPLTSHHDCCL